MAKPRKEKTPLEQMSTKQLVREIKRSLKGKLRDMRPSKSLKGKK